MKNIVKSFGLLGYFIATQCLATVALIFYKYYTDEDWLYAVNDCILENGVVSTEYFRLVSEILFPALILADIIVIAPMLFYAYRKKESVFQKITKKESISLFRLAIFINLIVSAVVSWLPDMATNDYNQMMSIVTNGKFGIVLLTSGILAPIIEELIFRYGICGIFSKKSEQAQIVVSALLFGIAHWNIIQSTYAFLFGLFLGYLYVKTKNLTYPVLFHLVVNSSSVIYEYAPKTLQTAGICFAILCGASFVFQRGLTKTKEQKIQSC